MQKIKLTKYRYHIDLMTVLHKSDRLKHFIFICKMFVFDCLKCGFYALLQVKCNKTSKMIVCFCFTLLYVCRNYVELFKGFFYGGKSQRKEWAPIS